MNKKRFYTIKELALALEVSVSTIHNYRKDKLLKAYQLNGKGIWRIDPSEYKRVLKGIRR